MRRLALVLLLLSGCVVKSLGPFYSDRSLIYFKDVVGDWRLLTDAGGDVSTNAITSWAFNGTTATDCTLLAFDKQNNGATFDVRFFRLGKDVFVDVLPKDLNGESKVNSYWVCIVHPTHTVCKVELKDDKLTLKPLDYDWLRKHVEEHKASLPYTGKLDDERLYSASPKQWDAFLSKQSKNTEAFPDKNAFVLKKAALAK